MIVFSDIKRCQLSHFTHSFKKQNGRYGGEDAPAPVKSSTYNILMVLTSAETFALRHFLLATYAKELIQLGVVAKIVVVSQAGKPLRGVCVYPELPWLKSMLALTFFITSSS